MRFQYFSDIHLEFFNGNTNKIKRVFMSKLAKQQSRPEVLLLAGDIGNPFRKCYQIFLEDVSLLYDKVIVIAGNHEYYKAPVEHMSDVDAKCRDICQSMPRENVVFLQNESYDLTPDISIYGGTFWTDIPHAKHRTVQYTINDYSMIPGFTPTMSCMFFDRALQGLKNCIEASPPDREWIVMSHHMPSFSLIDPKYRRPQYADMNCAFASEIGFAHHPQIKAWVYGHTHTPLQSGKFYCNPIGYPGENNTWSLDYSFEIL